MKLGNQKKGILIYKSMSIPKYLRKIKQVAACVNIQERVKS